MMKDKRAKRLGIEAVARIRRTVEITMSDDWADCVAHQADELLGAVDDNDENKRQELQDLVDIINEVLR